MKGRLLAAISAAAIHPQSLSFSGYAILDFFERAAIQGHYGGVLELMNSWVVEVFQRNENILLSDRR
jgi:hypothetical protein